MSEHINQYHKGANWRKWDLHFHAPSKYTCAKNDQYEGANLSDKQNNFIDEIKGVEGISVAGITDYFSLDGYKLVESKKNDLGNFDLILPNIELRITPVTGKNRKLNLHIIPNTEVLTIEEIERFLHKFEFGPEKFTCKEADLIELGKKLGVTASDEEAFKKGLNEFCISYDTFFKTLNESNSKLKDNILIGVSNDSKDGASGIKDISGVRDIIYSGVDFIFSPRATDREYFLGRGADTKEQIINKYGRLIPCLHGSDYHGSKNGKTMCAPDEDRYCWIKADPSFEGLRQILYEPEDRVIIQPSSPENKTGYQVINQIQIESDSIYNQQVSLNPYLNSIIGGRSSGKSVFLGAIAKRLKSTRPFQLADKDYEDYVSSVSQTIRIIWKDEKEEDDREVEYFEQGYMHKIARDESELNNIIQGILVQKGKEADIEAYKKFATQNSKSIAAAVSDYYMLLGDIKEAAQKARDKGDKKGIEDEIIKLKEELNKLSGTALSNDEKVKYEDSKDLIEKNEKQIQTLSADINHLAALQNLKIFKDSIDYELISLSTDYKNAVSQVFEKIKLEGEKKWKEEIQRASNNAIEQRVKLSEQNTDLAKDEIYLKGLKAYQDNAQLTEFESRIKTQEAKLHDIKTLLSEIESLKKELSQTKDKIKDLHSQFHAKADALIPKLSDYEDGLEIKAKLDFKTKEYQNILNSSLNLQSWENQQLAKFKYDDFNSFEDRQLDFFEKLEADSITLKGGYTPQSLTSALLSNNFFGIKYDIEYESDDFKKMSDGKKAFVVLKLLLDFNDKKCPILIDQPEDDLDNRAIYNDLVQYLRKKKKERQIIVATHNPNIVVGADSELVICANQHGEKNINTDAKKFQYVTGSLEHTFQKIDGKEEILESQGIREHVCEVLEGGNTAFKLRERKYAIKE